MPEKTQPAGSGSYTSSDPKAQLFDRVKEDFGNHKPPSSDAGDGVRKIRAATMDLARLWIEYGVLGRDLSMALTHLEEGQRCVIAGIAKTWPLAD